MNLVGKLLLLGSAALVGCNGLATDADKSHEYKQEENSLSFDETDKSVEVVVEEENEISWFERIKCECKFRYDTWRDLKCGGVVKIFYDKCVAVEGKDLICARTSDYRSRLAMWLKDDKLVEISKRFGIYNFGITKKCGDKVVMTFPELR